MARSLRIWGALLLVLVAGCSAAPAQHPAASATIEPIALATLASTPMPNAAPPTAAPAATDTPPGQLAAQPATPAPVAPAPLDNSPTVAVALTAPAGAPAQADAVSPASGRGALAQADAVSPASGRGALAQADAVSPASGRGAAAPADAVPQDGAPPAADAACDGTARPDPLPPPGSPGSQAFFRSFRIPLAPAPLYDPPGPRRVGLQAGHWLTNEVPPELGRLQGGAIGGGKQEWEVNLDVARRAATLLEVASIRVDVLPATVPPAYRANAFIALHADGDPSGAASGFKVARPGFSSLPEVDDRLVDTLNQVYAADTELPRDDEHISLRMRYYYAFNSRRYCHAVAPGVPQAIVEMGYLTSPQDRQLLIGNPDRPAQALADAIQTFLTTIP